jgi:DNA-binding NtrC family response regulator
MNILIVSENRNNRENIEAALRMPGRKIVGMESAKDISQVIEKNNIKLIILDYKLSHFPYDLIEGIKERFSRILFIMIASSNSLEEGMNILRHEPFFYTIHPINLLELKTIADAAMEKINFNERIIREV